MRTPSRASRQRGATPGKLAPTQVGRAPQRPCCRHCDHQAAQTAGGTGNKQASGGDLPLKDFVVLLPRHAAHHPQAAVGVGSGAVGAALRHAGPGHPPAGTRVKGLHCTGAEVWGAARVGASQPSSASRNAGAASTQCRPCWRRHEARKRMRGQQALWHGCCVWQGGAVEARCNAQLRPFALWPRPDGWAPVAGRVRRAAHPRT